MSKIDENYHKLLTKIIDKGYKYDDPNRESVQRIEIPSYTFRHEFNDGFPAIATKKLYYKNVVTELLWFLKGDTNIKYLIDNRCNIWNKDAYNHFLKDKPTLIKSTSIIDRKVILFEKDNKSHFNLFLGEVKLGNLGDLGPVYGKQWRNFNGVDQIKDLIQGLKDKPLGTEHIVTAWNPGEKFKMALPACHYGFQIVVRPLNYTERLTHVRNIGLTCKTTSANNAYKEWDIFFIENDIPKYGFELHWSQRSVDTFLGLPYNITSYATLALILEKITGYKALAIQGDLKKVHLYDNSLDAVKEQLSRDPNKYNKCELSFKSMKGQSNEIGLKSDESLDTIINNLYIEGFELKEYESYPHIVVEMLERDE